MTQATPNKGNTTGDALGQLQVGAAKVDITPPADALPAGYKAIHDPVYVRAIVVDNRQSKAVLLSADLVIVGDDFYADVAQALAQAVGCPVEQILISATHTHSSPTPHLTPLPGRQSNSFLCFDPTYAARIKAGMLAAVQQAQAKLQPVCTLLNSLFGTHH